MKVVLKEGWLRLDMIRSDGREVWEFYEYKPDWVEDTFVAQTSEFIPGKIKQIMYCEADNAEIE